VKVVKVVMAEVAVVDEVAVAVVEEEVVEVEEVVMKRVGHQLQSLAVS